MTTKMSVDINIREPKEFNFVELHGCLEEVAKKIGLNDFKYHVDLISGKGDFYVANTFRVVIEDKNNGKHVNVIVKTLTGTRRELFYHIHEREVNVYEEVISKYKDIQSKLDKKQRIWFPECLYTNADSYKQVIILRDLKDSGFDGNDKKSTFDELNYGQIKKILTELAKFHGLSFVHERIEKENFNELKEKFGDLVYEEKYLNKSKLRNYYSDSYGKSLELVANAEVKKKLQKVQNKLFDILRFYSRPGKHTVLCHGDLWPNNILFKQDSEDNELCFIDYQGARYYNPALDIISFIYRASSKFRSDHLENLTQDYYDSLTSFLTLFDMDVNIVYPKTDFLEDMKKHLPFGLLIGLIELTLFFTVHPEYKEKVEVSKKVIGLDSTEVTEEIDFFRYKVNDLVDESVNNGVLDRLLHAINNL